MRVLIFKKMNERQENLLKSLIKEHLRTAEPVGSRLLEEKSKLNVSSATIRNEMAELEELGYIYQPHTSAGRVPTEKAYKHYLPDYFAGNLSLKDTSELEIFLKPLKNEPTEMLIKALAKKVASLSDTAVVIGFSENSFYYTGLSYLFGQPEFQDPEIIYDLSLVIDHLDQAMGKMFKQVLKPEIYIGSDNPFGAECSIVMGYWQFQDHKGIMGLLGPMRMDYQKNVGLINFMNNF